MKISVDGGALYPKNNQRFGTSVFSESLIQALNLYDKKNQYFIYTFKNLKPKLFWMKGRVSLEELKQKKDVFLALNQAIPFYTSGKIISFCHGLSYYFYPQYYPRKDNLRLRNQLEDMIKRSDKIIVSSKKVKDELVSIYRPCLPAGKYIETKIIILPFGIPLDMVEKNVKYQSFDKAQDDPERSRTGQMSNVKNRGKYFLFVCMDHPIKNIAFIEKVFNKFKKDKDYKDYKLYKITKNVSREKLKRLYQNATALLTSSYYESFNFPVLEALSQNCPVVGLKSAIIPEFKPYVQIANNSEEFVKKIKKVIEGKIKPVLINRLIDTFNWKKYINNLVRLY